jgi:hypothetical protein
MDRFHEAVSSGALADLLFQIGELGKDDPKT